MQLELLSWEPPAPPCSPPLGAIGEETRFEKFDRAYPEIWRLFVVFTLDRIEKGFEHYSSDAIVHRIRWETDASVDDGFGFKINDHFTAYYARKFHDDYPEHKGFFRTRHSRFDREAV